MLICEAVLFAQLPHRRCHLAQIVPRQRGEQVVLDLVVQAACMMWQWRGSGVNHCRRLLRNNMDDIMLLQQVFQCFSGCVVAFVAGSVWPQNATTQARWAPVNQSFQMPAVMSRVDTIWAVTKSLVSQYTSMPLWLCTNTMLSKKPLNTCSAHRMHCHVSGRTCLVLSGGMLFHALPPPTPALCLPTAWCRAQAAHLAEDHEQEALPDRQEGEHHAQVPPVVQPDHGQLLPRLHARLPDHEKGVAHVEPPL